MVLEVKRGHDEDSDTDFDIMNSAVSTESMDMAEEDMSQVEGCGLSGSEEDDECASSPAGSAYDDQDMIKTAMSDEVTKQLAAAGRLGQDPPRGPSTDWRVLTTADVAGTNGLTCPPKHGGTRDRGFLVAHPMADHCENCFTSMIAAEPHAPSSSLSLFNTWLDRIACRTAESGKTC
ncbi:hypothetical protein evm_007472 [Chilo suppressalis]|nr:hypothetical protein evm_007472 [Chilo suppressalis]